MAGGCRVQKLQELGYVLVVLLHQLDFVLLASLDLCVLVASNYVSKLLKPDLGNIRRKLGSRYVLIRLL